ncbi:hypothetical protein CULC0102_0027 [Corynebacterium ulcerans 0102]|nr:hypothetical protein CULC0102_0027 [Corynebacterium ulcerans 0102]
MGTTSAYAEKSVWWIPAIARKWNYLRVRGEKGSEVLDS